MNTVRMFSMKKSCVAGALVLSQLLCLAPSAVLAADNSVRFAGQPIFSNLASTASMSGTARAEQIQQNLDNALVAAKDRTPAAVNITYVRGLPVITMGGYQVMTVDGASAKANGTTPAVLAQRWADNLRNALRDQNSVQDYVAQLSGDYQNSAPPVTSAPPIQQSNYSAPPAQSQYGGPAQYGGTATYNATQPAQPGYGPPPGPYQGPPGAYQQGGAGYRQGRVAYAPAGLTMQAMLTTSIDSQVARPGDVIQANLSQPIILGDTQIPTGSVLLGQVAEAKRGGYLGLSGKLEIQFNRLRTPDGVETPIVAHIVGGIGKYQDRGGGQMVGETWKGKTVQAVGRGAVGAGLGAALGTAVGAIAGGGHGVGRGAWSGTAIGGGLGVVDSMTLRKGKDVLIQSGTPIQVQLDAPISMAGGPNGVSY